MCSEVGQKQRQQNQPGLSDMDPQAEGPVKTMNCNVQLNLQCLLYRKISVIKNTVYCRQLRVCVSILFLIRPHVLFSLTQT